jgi:cytochrome c oxidase cbb3-type subunit III
MSEINDKNKGLSESDKAVLLDHDYDGIQELDHPLPKWWVMIFWLTSLFGLGYFYYYNLGSGPTLKDEWHKEAVELYKVNKAYIEKLTEFNSEKYGKISGSPDMVNYGAIVYDQNCLQCHADKGAGDIGPNLTDNYWLFADGKPETVYPFVVTGNPINGMPQWGGVLNEDDLYAVTAYILSLKGTVHANPKAPQGEEILEAGK